MKKKALIIIAVITVLISSLGLVSLAAGPGSGVTQMASATVTAMPTSSTVQVNGVAVPFQAYTIDGYNYFKLRDLGKALNGTAKQFEIGYDSTNNAIAITTGKAYTPVGGELISTGDTTGQQATLSTASVYIDGTKAGLTAYTINGNNYLKLRDVAAAINFGVTYNNATGNIGIDTTTGYNSDTAPTTNPIVGAWHFDLTIGGLNYTSYLIFSGDGTLTQFVGNCVATYKADDSNVYVISSKDGSTETDSYSITSANGQTTLFIKATQLGVMVRDGVTTDTGANTIPGLWLSKNSVYSNSTSNKSYFYFTKSGNILIGIVDIGKYTISASGDTFSDNITSDGSYETTAFKITAVNGVTELIATDSKGNQTIMYKE